MTSNPLADLATQIRAHARAWTYIADHWTDEEIMEQIEGADRFDDALTAMASVVPQIEAWQVQGISQGEASRLKLADKIRTLLPDGMTFDPDASTGGNCKAMCIEDRTGRRVEITDGDSDLPFTSPECPGVVFSYYTDEGDPDGELTIETGGEVPSELFWENLGVSVKAWIGGDPYRDM